MEENKEKELDEEVINESINEAVDNSDVYKRQVLEQDRYSVNLKVLKA